MSKKLSIVIACYNDPDVVVAIRSAASQTYTNKEIIVINDGSNNETAKAIDNVKGLVDILITQDNSGQSIARNKGIKKATGEYILNLDSDDYFESSFCEKAVNKLEENKDIKIVTCKARRFNAKGEIDIFSPRGGSINEFLYSNSALGSSMFRRKDWEKVGGYEENLPILGFEDWELFIQILKEGGRAYVLQEVLFNYQVRENSTTAKIQHLKHEKFCHIILKHKELYKENFETSINYFFDEIEKLEREKKKILQQPDFFLGNFLLKPFRFVKNKWNKR